jgi:hypothetical protein
VNQVNQVINTLERATETMDLTRNVEQWVLMFDFKGYSMSNAPPMSTSRQVLDIFMVILINIYYRLIIVLLYVKTLFFKRINILRDWVTLFSWTLHGFFQCFIVQSRLLFHPIQKQKYVIYYVFSTMVVCRVSGFLKNFTLQTGSFCFRIKGRKEKGFRRIYRC